jgi:hypothetical protein
MLGAGCEHPPLHHPGAAAQSPSQSPSQSASFNMQGNETDDWMNDPHMHAFYDAAREAFAGGPDRVDVPAFEAKSRDIFQAFAVSRHLDPAAMQDHLKAIPAQVVAIAKEDPKVLDSYANFTVALVGPP